MGYRVDAIDFTPGALVRARAEHPETRGVRWLCLDIEHDPLPSPPTGGRRRLRPGHPASECCVHPSAIARPVRSGSAVA
ncbi:hypothetical protein ABZ776_20205 [Streptomyces sp. NPDC007076]|uniref:hypothetical protein n=1 Tax=Streptomyces sp. NPDC007076 TaxID=3160975 RepID=UPI00340BC5B4